MQSQDLVQRIERIIALIPDDFVSKDKLVESLKKREESISLTTPPDATSHRWQEIASLLSNFLPDPNKVSWAKKISKIMTAE